MQPEEGGFLVRREGSGNRERIPCVLSPRCMERHLPVDCILFRKLPVQHRISLLSAAGVCKKCLSHSERNSERTRQCEERSKDDHWLCRSFSDPSEGGVATRLLPVVTPQAGRLVYKCRTVLHVKSRADLETDNYSVQLTTLYDSNQRQSYITNEVAAAQALRYVRVPSKMVYTSSTTLGKTSKLYILDVKPRSKAADVGPLLLTAYGLDKTELMLPEEPKLNMLRKRFEERPGRLSNASVAQPEVPAHLVIGRDNQLHMREVVARSIRGGSDLYFMRSDCFLGEMIYGETEASIMKKGKTTSGPKTTSTPKSKGSPAAGPSGSGDRRRRDSSPALSVAASGSMVSSLGRTASDTPVRDGGERKISGSGGQTGWPIGGGAEQRRRQEPRGQPSGGVARQPGQ
jgi:hypothetical protein